MRAISWRDSFLPTVGLAAHISTSLHDFHSQPGHCRTVSCSPMMLVDSPVSSTKYYHGKRPFSKRRVLLEDCAHTAGGQRIEQHVSASELRQLLACTLSRYFVCVKVLKQGPHVLAGIVAAGYGIKMYPQPERKSVNGHWSWLRSISNVCETWFLDGRISSMM
jgi:hypothetical protein